MAGKSLPSSSGYFNKKMLAALEGGAKKSEGKKSTKSTNGKKK